MKLKKVVKNLASLRLAVLVIVLLAIIAAVGTIYEAKYDAQMAQKLVYRSSYMYVVMGLLIVNLIAVMVDRWPWKTKHISFVLAHIGIIILLLGSYMTQKLGVDGNLALTMGGANQYVSVDGTELAIFASFDGKGLTPLYQRTVDFLINPPQKEKIVFGREPDQIEVIDYYHYAIQQSEILQSDKPNDGPALRIQLQNSRVNMSQWLKLEPGKDTSVSNLGPAKVVLTLLPYKYEGGNVLVLTPDGERWKYFVFTQSRGGLTGKGKVQEGDQISLGWMELKMTLLRSYTRAREILTYEKRNTPTQQTRSAVKIRYQGDEYWIGLNSVVKLFTSEKMYYISFAQRRIDLGFPIKLQKFNIGRYQGTMRASSYESEVLVPDLGEQKISMNEPLKYKGFTFYQASFEQDEMGKPTMSILSVNYDPGRWIKYFGSLGIVLGVIMLFYFRGLGRSTKSVGIPPITSVPKREVLNELKN
ncbi:MAG: cytochrome c biogenesis protein ResB [Bdellovibrionales bacterium]|nr:cytochrome c biogenesis protein ResB [Bdellovibrionales bacterium]